MMSTYNRMLYDPWWLYREAQIVDEWPETPPEGGTSLVAAFDVLRTVGHRQMFAGMSRLPQIKHGIVAVNRWIQTVDETRSAAAEGHVMLDGIPWFQNFYKPIEKRVTVRGKERVEYWLPEPKNWGKHVGYHCIVAAGASDERQAVPYHNSWGRDYPWPVYCSYASREKLIASANYGESAIVTDR